MFVFWWGVGGGECGGGGGFRVLGGVLGFAVSGGGLGYYGVCVWDDWSAWFELALGTVWGWVLLYVRADQILISLVPGSLTVSFQGRAWLFMARTRKNRHRRCPAMGEVTDEPVQVISRAAAIDVAKASGMVCVRLPLSPGGAGVQKVWEVTRCSPRSWS